MGKKKQEDDAKWMDWKAFQDEGYLMEVNRIFFHPLGLMMVLKNNSKGKVTLQ